MKSKITVTNITNIIDGKLKKDAEIKVLILDSNKPRLLLNTVNNMQEERSMMHVSIYNDLIIEDGKYYKILQMRSAPDYKCDECGASFTGLVYPINNENHVPQPGLIHCKTCFGNKCNNY